MSRTFRIAGLLLLLGLGAVAAGCCDSRAGLLGLPPAIETNDQVRFEFEQLSDRKLAIADGSPMWDLGWHEAAAGEDRLIIITCITSYSDLDDDRRAIPGTRRDREFERVWITIPKGAPSGQPLMLDKLEERGLIGYESRHAKEKTYFRAPCAMRGYVTPVEEQDGLPVIRYHMVIAPDRPFRREPWSLKGERSFGLMKEVEDERLR